MKKTGIFYGSTTGVTESIAEQIASKLGISDSDVHNVASKDVKVTDDYEALILGSSTWGAGDLQDDWYDFLDKLAESNLNGKTVALFGCGDGCSFGDTFCDAVGTIYEKLQGKGCTFIGAVKANGYGFDASTAEVNSGEFVGLLIDENNESDKTESRIQNWTEELKSNL